MPKQRSTDKSKLSPQEIHVHQLYAYGQHLHDNVLGKKCLVGLNPDGIQEAWLQEVVNVMPGALALKFSKLPTLPVVDDGVGYAWYDITTVKFFKVFETVSEVKETAGLSIVEALKDESVTSI